MTAFERINNLSKKQGLSLRDLARKAGLGETTIYGWKNRTPDSAKLETVANVLGVSVDYLLTGSNKKGPVDLADDEQVFMYQGRPIPEEEWKIIKRILGD